MTEVNSFKQCLSPTYTFEAVIKCKWEGVEGSVDSRSNNNIEYMGVSRWTFNFDLCRFSRVALRWKLSTWWNGIDVLQKHSVLNNSSFLLLLAPHVKYMKKDEDVPCSITSSLEHFPQEEAGIKEEPTRPPQNPPTNLTVVTVEGCPTFVILDWDKPANDTVTGWFDFFPPL